MLSRLDRLAKSDDARVRAARIDCIGFTREPTYDHQQFEGKRWIWRQAAIKCSPPILIGPVFSGEGLDLAIPYLTSTGSDSPQTLADFPKHYRIELERIMLASKSSPQEREAAARAIVAWPPEDYQLRFAEWGVWINSGGRFHLVDSVIDEIPDFVHRTGNELESFKDRLTIPMIIAKPVIHLTTDQPMAVDLEVMFNAGRPWFAYPMPDDFQLSTSWTNRLVTTPPFLEKFDQQSTGKLEPVQAGYPWALPAHQQHHQGEIAGLGLHWQSVIVSPTKLPWMKLPTVDPDPKYAWWSDLRDVQCSWVCNRNESERYIYYDGPTLANSPINIEYETGEIKVKKQEIFTAELTPAVDFDSTYFKLLLDLGDRTGEEAPDVTIDEIKAATGFEGIALSELENLYKKAGQLESSRQGFYIRVDDNGAKGTVLTLNDGFKADLEQLELESGDEIKKNLLAALLKAGLNEQEADGLIKCWTPAFFEEPGQRIVFLLYPTEYELMCPMKIRPQPTEVARVGLVLTELID